MNVILLEDTCKNRICQVVLVTRLSKVNVLPRMEPTERVHPAANAALKTKRLNISCLKFWYPSRLFLKIQGY